MIRNTQLNNGSYKSNTFIKRLYITLRGQRYDYYKSKNMAGCHPDFSTVIQCQWLMTSRSERIENSSFL